MTPTTSAYRGNQIIPPTTECPVIRFPYFLVGLALALLATHSAYARTISFAGLVWEVRSGNGAPGNGCWSDDEQSVWVDESGYLHLRVRQLPDGRWCQAEVRARSYADYGNHLFWTNSRLDLLGPTTVFGMFLYADDYNEIDIETTRAFDPDYNLLYVVQPRSASAPSSSYRTTFSLNGVDGRTYSSHRFTWSGDDTVKFASWHGHCLEPPCGSVIASWSYDGRNTPSNTDLLQPRINLWIRGDDPPSPQEVIVETYRGAMIPRPTTTTSLESAVTTTGATLGGFVDPNGWSTTAWFEYGTSTDYESSTRASRESLGSGTDPKPVSHAISGLQCGTTYHFRAVGTNVAGTSYGDDRTFDTVACAPVVSTGSATPVGPTSATLNATVSPNGATTTVVFEYGLTPAYGSIAHSRTITGSTEESLATVVAPLQCDTTYHFRAVATNEGGTTLGENRTFRTASCDDTPPRRHPVRSGR